MGFHDHPRLPEGAYDAGAFGADAVIEFGFEFVESEAEFVGAAQSNAVVIIKVPTQPATLTRVGGTETMTASNFKLQGGLSKRTLAKADSFTFRVGATLNIGAGQVEGTYLGTFDVTVQYP